MISVCLSQDRDDYGMLWNSTRRADVHGHGCPRSEKSCQISSFHWSRHAVTSGRFHIHLLIHAAIQQSSGCRRPAGCGGPGSGPGDGQSGSSVSNPRRRADSGREAGFRVLRSGEEGRVAHAHRESGKRQLLPFNIWHFLLLLWILHIKVHFKKEML